MERREENADHFAHPKERLSAWQILSAYLLFMGMLFFITISVSELVGEVSPSTGPLKPSHFLRAHGRHSRYLEANGTSEDHVNHATFSRSNWNPVNSRDEITGSRVVIAGTSILVVSAIVLSCILHYVDRMQERLFLKSLLDDDEMQFIRRMVLLEGGVFRLGPMEALNHEFTPEHVRKDFPVYVRWCLPRGCLKKIAKYQQQTQHYSDFRTQLTAQKPPSLKYWDQFLFASILGSYRGIVLSKAMLGRSRVDKIILGDEDDPKGVVHKQKMRLVHMLDHQTARFIQAASTKPIHEGHLIKIDDTRNKNPYKKAAPINGCKRFWEFKSLIANLWCLRLRFEHPYMEFLFRYDPFITRNQRLATLLGSMTAALVTVAVLYHNIDWFKDISPYGFQLVVAGLMCCVVQYFASKVLYRMMRWSSTSRFQNRYNDLWKEIRIREAAEKREGKTKEGFLMMKKYYESTTSRPEKLPPTKNGKPVIVQQRLECDYGLTSKLSCAMTHCCLKDMFLYEGLGHPNDSDVGTDDEVIYGWVNPPTACVKRCSGLMKCCRRHPNQRAPWLRKAIIYDDRPKGCCWIGRRPRIELGENIDEGEALDTIAAEEVVRNSLALNCRDRCETCTERWSCKVFTRYRPIHGIYVGDDVKFLNSQATKEETALNDVRVSKEHIKLGSALPPKSYELPIIYVAGATGAISEDRVKALAHWLGVIKKVLIIPEKQGTHSIYIFMARWDTHNPEVVQFQIGLSYGKVTLEGPNGETWHCKEKPPNHMIPKSILRGDGTRVSHAAGLTTVQSSDQADTPLPQAPSNRSISVPAQRDDGKGHQKVQHASKRAALLHHHSSRPIYSVLRGNEVYIVWPLYGMYIVCCAFYMFWWWQEFKDQLLGDLLRGIAMGQVFITFFFFPLISYCRALWHIAFSIPYSRCLQFLPIIGSRLFALGGLKGPTGRSLSGRLTFVGIPQAAGMASGLVYQHAVLAFANLGVLGEALVNPANTINHRKHIRAHNAERDGGRDRLIRRYHDFTMKKSKTVIPPEWLYQRGLIKRYLQLRYRRGFLTSAVERFVEQGVERRRENRERQNCRYSPEARGRWIRLRKYVLSGRARKDALQDEFFTVSSETRAASFTVSSETRTPPATPEQGSQKSSAHSKKKRKSRKHSRKTSRRHEVSQLR